MTQEEIELRNRELEIEEKKLSIEEKKVSREEKIIYKHLGIIITSIISVATISVSIIQLVNNNKSKENELEIVKENNINQLKLAEINNNRNYDLSIANFLMENKPELFSESSEERDQLFDVLTITFGDEKVDSIFKRIQSMPESPLFKLYLDRLIGDERHHARSQLVVLYQKEPAKLQEVMFLRLKSPNVAYREQLGILHTLSKIKNGWSDVTNISYEIEKIIQTDNVDEALLKNAKNALDNRNN